MDAVILSVFFRREWLYGETEAETSRIIAEVMEGLEGEREGESGHFPGEDAWFCLADRRCSDGESVAKSSLRVAANRRTGYGALVWFADKRFPRSGGIYDSVWVSDNPEPPDFDPSVVSDPGYPLFHDPASTLPIPVVREAVEEFCRAGTGERPESIGWIAGEMNGQRSDRSPIVDFVEDPVLDWDSLR
ncbi:Imm1 family immunity protein [Streptomyces sp. NPDC002755]|uniref:Imm1 family immunity protein n=1 Tax=Streptomyces sp. NPDC002884 TaxID=3154544 RepID=UPI003334822D